MPNLVESLQDKDTLAPPGYIGVDPGWTGGLCYLRGSSGRIVAATDMPDTEEDIWNWFKERRNAVQAIIEQVHAMPGNGVSSMFKFGGSYYMLRMAMTAAGIPYELVQPATWQKALGIPKRKPNESSAAWKHRLKTKAQQLFPGNSCITKENADSVLIAEYGRRKLLGRL